MTASSHISIFDSPAGFSIRVLEIKGAPWFVAADVCRALGIQMQPNGPNVTVAVRKLDADEKTLFPIQGSRMVSLVSESGLYKLILRCDKAEAKVFQDWVTREVLPAIRKDGAYIMGEEKVRTGEMSEDELVLQALTILQTKVQRLTKERDEALAEINTVTVDEYRALSHRYMSHADKVRLGQAASRIAKQRGIELTKQPRTIIDTWGTQRETFINVYPRDVLVEAERHLRAMR